MELKLLIENFILDFGIIGSFLLVFLEYANLPLPSEIVLPVIGIMASEYEFNLLLLITITTIGGLAGSLTNYFLGYKYGKPLLEKIMIKMPSLKKSIYASQKYMDKYNKSSLLLSRMVPIARTAISIIAGVGRVDMKTFIGYSVVGISIWNTILIYLGFAFNDNLELVMSILSKYSAICLMLIVISAFIFLSLKLKERTK